MGMNCVERLTWPQAGWIIPDPVPAPASFLIWGNRFKVEVLQWFEFFRSILRHTGLEQIDHDSGPRADLLVVVVYLQVIQFLLRFLSGDRSK